jgi:hypothetical protein
VTKSGPRDREGICASGSEPAGPGRATRARGRWASDRNPGGADAPRGRGADAGERQRTSGQRGPDGARDERRTGPGRDELGPRPARGRGRARPPRGRRPSPPRGARGAGRPGDPRGREDWPAARQDGGPDPCRTTPPIFGVGPSPAACAARGRRIAARPTDRPGPDPPDPPRPGATKHRAGEGPTRRPPAAPMDRYFKRSTWRFVSATADTYDPATSDGKGRAK